MTDNEELHADKVAGTAVVWQLRAFLPNDSAIARAALIASTMFECIRHIVGGRITITPRLQSPAVFDQR
jgi:hypothetical protein